MRAFAAVGACLRLEECKMKVLVLLVFLVTGCLWGTTGQPRAKGTIQVYNATTYDMTVYALRNGQRVCTLGRVGAQSVVRRSFSERCLTALGHLGVRFVLNVYRGRIFYDLDEEILVGALPVIVDLSIRFPVSLSIWRVYPPETN